MVLGVALACGSFLKRETSSGSTTATTTRVAKKFFRRVIEIRGKGGKKETGRRKKKRDEERRLGKNTMSIDCLVSMARIHTHARRFFSPLPSSTEAREASFSGVDSRIMFREHSRSVCHVWDGQFAGGQPVAFFLSRRDLHSGWRRGRGITSNAWNNSLSLS